MNYNQINIRNRSKMFNQYSSTPMTRSKNPRESLGRIKQNTVSGMVKFFTQQASQLEEEESNSESPSEFDQKPPKDDTLIVTQISYFNDLSSINQASHYGSDSKIDSGYDSIASRERSQSYNEMNKYKGSTILESYAKYPNFKLSYLKYFGENPKEFLSRYDYDLDAISDISTGREAISGNNGCDVSCVNEFVNKRKRSQSFSAKTVSKRNNGSGVACATAFDRPRERSQSFNAKTISKPTKPKYRHQPKLKLSHLKYFGIDSSHPSHSTAFMENDRKEMPSKDVMRGERFATELLAGSLQSNFKNASAGLHKKLNGASFTPIQEMLESNDPDDGTETTIFQHYKSYHLKICKQFYFQLRQMSKYPRNLVQSI